MYYALGHLLALGGAKTQHADNVQLILCCSCLLFGWLTAAWHLRLGQGPAFVQQYLGEKQKLIIIGCGRLIIRYIQLVGTDCSVQ
jgi:hypothetical protein